MNTKTYTRNHMKWTVSAIVAIFVCGHFTEYGNGQEAEFKSVQLANEQTIDYGVVVPKDFDSEKNYPVLLALPPGAQNEKMVQAGFNLYWNAGVREGWVVISPAAPRGKAFNQGSENLIPEFLDEVQKTYKPEGNKFYLAGVSNGGTSAFRVAGKYPERFHSLLVLPGTPPAEQDKQRLKHLKDMPIAMFVGEKDAGWVKSMEETVAALKKLGADVSFEIVPGQGHVIQNWQDGDKLFGILNKWRTKSNQAN